MTAYSQTIRNTCRVWGPEPTEKWYSAACGTVSLVWGTDKWAYGTVGLPINFTKRIAAGTTSILTEPSFRMTKGITDAVANTTTVGRKVTKGITNAVANTSTANRKFTKGVKNTFTVFGPEPTEKWYSAACGTVSLVWGSDKWGYGTVGLPTVFTKGIAAGSTAILTEPSFRLTKGITDSVAPSSTIAGKNVSKGIADAVANTTTANRRMTKGITDSVPITTAVGKNMMHVVYDSTALTDYFIHGMSYSRRFYETFVFTSSQAVYSMREDYYRTVGGISNVVSWPSSAGFTNVVGVPLTWSQAAATSTSWV